MSIQATKDYSIFKKQDCNREISTGNLNKIISSIKAKNLLEFRPIIVNQNMEVIDGQHRLEAAKHLGVDIWYKVDHSSQIEDIILLNTNQKKWNLPDYLNYYLNTGRVEYDKLKRFMDSQKIDLRTALRLLGSSDPNNATKFRAGTYKFPPEETHLMINARANHYNEIRDIISTHRINGKAICSKSKFLDALMSFIRIEEMDYAIFKERISNNLEKVRICATYTEYFEMLKKIYNFRNKEPLL